MQNIMIRAMEKQDFRVREAYKTLRTNLEFSGMDVKVIALTSCTEDEGKTSVSFQLAVSLAEAGRKTILVDADLRKSVLHGRYKATRERYGLSHYLSGQARLEDAVCATNIPDFHIIFAGQVPPNPSELLGGDRFKTLVERFRAEYDYIIIDTPPLGSVIDSAIVARECDGVVLVIEAKAISYKFARTVKEQLERAECRILGCVLNKVEPKGGAYYSKYYGSKGAEGKRSRASVKEHRKEETEGSAEKEGPETIPGKKADEPEAEEKG
ncbi:MAG TPA: polysaccharide biosynthesis tyrosine autokinase [Candidatus Eisenbergiella merdavium]|uniref:non-specific protein-tyrosine kinase n=1 Tax=Candidatus Eisenbergiella merdavium TaxID=2838551 RepID=A0A9D2SR30_9FIRM|nr:polysaccharide biosynthesis tyrosine autokinase [Candidatus Eisenbergiella merdavium]